MRGLRDTLYYLIDKTVFWIAEFLEALSDLLAAKHGPTWFIGTPVERFPAPRKGE